MTDGSRELNSWSAGFAVSRLPVGEFETRLMGNQTFISDTGHLEWMTDGGRPRQ